MAEFKAHSTGISAYIDGEIDDVFEDSVGSMTTLDIRQARSVKAVATASKEALAAALHSLQEANLLEHTPDTGLDLGEAEATLKENGYVKQDTDSMKTVGVCPVSALCSSQQELQHAMERIWVKRRGQIDQEDPSIKGAVLRIELRRIAKLSPRPKLDEELEDAEVLERLPAWTATMGPLIQDDYPRLHRLQTSGRMHSWEIQRWKLVESLLTELASTSKTAADLRTKALPQCGKVKDWHAAERNFNAAKGDVNPCFDWLCGARWDPPQELIQWRVRGPQIVDLLERRVASLAKATAALDASITGHGK